MIHSTNTKGTNKQGATSTGGHTSAQTYKGSNGHTMYRINDAVGCSSRTLAEAFIKMKIL